MRRAEDPYLRAVHPDAHKMLEWRRRARRKPSAPKGPSAAAVARAEKVAWLERVATESGAGCREWPWALNSNGYAVVRWGGRPTRVGHITMELSGRPRPGAAHMLHSCDNPRCAAPWHLRWGTNAENIADRMSRRLRETA